MNVNEIIKSETGNLCLAAPVGEISVPYERAIYSLIRTKYVKAARDAVKEYETIFSKYGNCISFLQQGEADFRKCMNSSISLVIRDLLSIGIDDYDADAIFSFSYEKGLFDGFFEPYERLLSASSEASEELNQMREYRQQRKDDRYRFVTDNSQAESISDVLSNEADTAIMNLGLSAVYSIANSVGNFFSESVAESKLDDLFNNPELKQTIMDGIYTSVVNLHCVVTAFSNDETYFDIPGEDEIEKSTKMLNNLIGDCYPEEKTEDICKEIIALNPYQCEIYEYMIKKYKDSDGMITKLADFFGVNLERYKSEMAFEYVKSVQGNTEAEAQKAKELLLAYATSISYDITTNSKGMLYIQNVIDDFDKKYRTVDGIECRTRDGADLARNELQKMRSFVNNVPASTTDSLLDYEEMVKAKIVEFESTFSSEIKPNYRKTLDKLLADFDVNFRKVKLFKASDRKQAGCQRALNYVKLLPFENLDEYNEAYLKYEEFLPKVGLTAAEAVEATAYMEEQRKRVAAGRKRSQDDGIDKNEKKLQKILFIVGILGILLGFALPIFFVVGIGCIIGGFIVKSKLKKQAADFAEKKEKAKSDNKNK